MDPVGSRAGDSVRPNKAYLAGFFFNRPQYAKLMRVTLWVIVPFYGNEDLAKYQQAVRVTAHAYSLADINSYRTHSFTLRFYYSPAL